MPARLLPANIQLIGDELAIAWNDGTESYLRLRAMRYACPCAGCGGEPDVLGNIERPDVSYTDDALCVGWAIGEVPGVFIYKPEAHAQASKKLVGRWTAPGSQGKTFTETLTFIP